MKKKYIIKSNANGKIIWCPIGKSGYKRGMFPTYWIRSSFTDVTRFNLIQAVMVCVYLKITHRWMRGLKIQKVPFYSLEAE